MTLLLDDRTVSSVLDPSSLVEAIESAIRAEALGASDVPERANLAGGGRFLRVMPAVVPNLGVMGLKTFFGGGGVGVRYLLVLISIETGEVLSAMDACWLTAARTAATSAVAARAMGVKTTSLGVLGSGLEAEVHVRTFVALGGVREVKVFSPNPSSRAGFAERLAGELGVRVRVADTAADVFRDVDHAITATNTGYGGPVACRSEWIPDGLHVTAIGSTHQDLRELEPETFRRADVLVFDADPAQIAAESGDMRAFVDDGGDLAGVVQLGDLLQGRAQAPSEVRGLSIFKSVGTALQDVVAADLAFRRALDAGLGTPGDQLAVPKTRR
ncbi:hypothetical protein [Cryptosporangium sp. NPDC048952]|uniref:hypothetical protein n=1 Tax=Cryptosporangium sp. NPDC048952 TaxID=3363961 RepID=UPI0037205EC6